MGKESSSLTYFEEKKNLGRSTVCMHLLKNKGKIKLSNNACPDWSTVYLAQLKSTPQYS